MAYLGGSYGLQKSVDDGDTWMRLLSGVPVSRVLDIAVAATDPRRVYVVARPTPDLKAESITVRSNDGGRTADWVVDWPSARFNTIAIHPPDPATIYVAGDGVFRSTDNGATWQVEKQHSVDEPRETAFYAWDVAASSRPPYRVYIAAGGRGIETWTSSRMLIFDTARWRTTSKGLQVTDEGWITSGNMVEDLCAAFLCPVTILTLTALIAGHACFLCRSGQSGGVGLSAYRAARMSLILVAAGLVAFLLPALVIVPMLIGGLLTAVEELMVVFTVSSLVVVSLLANSAYQRLPSRTGERNRTAAILFALLTTLAIVATLGEAVGYYVVWNAAVCVYDARH